jgi:hypothetical protein
MCSTESISPAISEASGFPDFHSIKPLTDRFIARLKGETLESNEHKIYQSGHVRADQNTTFPETSEWRLLRLGPIRDRHPNGRAKMLKYPGLPPSVPRKILQHTSGKTNTSVDYFLFSKQCLESKSTEEINLINKEPKYRRGFESGGKICSMSSRGCRIQFTILKADCRGFEGCQRGPVW